MPLFQWWNRHWKEKESVKGKEKEKKKRVKVKGIGWTPLTLGANETRLWNVHPWWPRVTGLWTKVGDRLLFHAQLLPLPGDSSPKATIGLSGKNWSNTGIWQFLSFYRHKKNKSTASGRAKPLWAMGSCGEKGIKCVSCLQPSAKHFLTTIPYAHCGLELDKMGMELQWCFD